MDRRLFLGALALGAVGALGGGALVGDGFYQPPPVHPRQFGAPRRIARPAPGGFGLPPHFFAPHLEKRRLPGGTLTELPGDGNLFALTVDDGASSEVVAAYVNFAQRSGLRFTFFVTGSFPSWAENAELLRPLVHTGQIQLGNHTFSHPDLTSSSNAKIEDELLRTDEFIRTTFGVDAMPYYRPPFGYYDERVVSVAASVGYTQPVMWHGSFSDSGDINDEKFLDFARRWLLAQHIVIGHANVPTVTRHFDDIAQLLRERGLQPVTLDDVFLRP